VEKIVKNRGGENGMIFPGGENGISPSTLINYKITTKKGVPVVSILSLPVFDWLCKTYTWSGASLISAGIILNCVIVILLFDNQKE